MLANDHSILLIRFHSTRWYIYSCSFYDHCRNSHYDHYCILVIFKMYFKIYLKFILTIHVLLPLITSIPNLQANSFSRIGVKVWNEIPRAFRNLPKNAFRRKLEQILLNILGSQDSYIDLSQIIKNVFSPGNISLTVFFQLTQIVSVHLIF